MTFAEWLNHRVERFVYLVSQTPEEHRTTYMQVQARSLVADALMLVVPGCKMTILCRTGIIRLRWKSRSEASACSSLAYRGCVRWMRHVSELHAPSRCRDKSLWLGGYDHHRALERARISRCQPRQERSLRKSRLLLSGSSPAGPQLGLCR